MAVNKAYSTYQANSIITAKPEELTLMLYNGILRFISQAQKNINGKNIPAAHEDIVKAQDIIMELVASLDHKYEIAGNLLQLYSYMHRQLIEANVKKDQQILAEVHKLVTELRDTWAQAMKIAKEQASSPQTASK